MSAENQGASAGTPTPPVDAGPVEISLVPNTPVVEKSEPKPDITDVTPKAEKPPEEVSDGSDPKDVGDQRDDKGRFKPGLQTRIDELTRSRREAEREAAYWKARANGTDSAQTPAPQAAPIPKPPVATDFATPEEYQDALVDYKVEQKLTLRDQRSKQVQAVTERADSWQTRLQTAKTAIADYSEVMDAADTPIANHVAELLFEHDLGANLAYHFAKNPDVLEKLNSMTPAKAAFEIGKLADKLDVVVAPTDDKSVKPELKAVDKPLSKAPPPAKTIGQGRSTSPSVEEMSMEEYVAQRNERKYGRRA